MKLTIKNTIAALGVLLFCAAPGLANAERVYFLVGTRHVFRIGTDMYARVADREKIEQDYADQIGADQDIYKKAIADGADPNQESANLNAALDDLSNERDKELGAIYENADYMRIRHPELQIQGDGPYQVMSVRFHMNADVEVIDSYSVFAPWPGYVIVGHPYGWAWGVVYSPFEFHHVYTTWYGGYVAMGSPAFVGIVGVSGPVSFSIGIGFGGPAFVRQVGVHPDGWQRSAYWHGPGSLHDRAVFVQNHPINRVIGNNAGGRNGGASRYSNGGANNGVSRYNRTNSNTGTGYNRTDSNTGSRYNRTGSSTGSGYSRGTSSSTTGSGYNRGNSGSNTGSRTGHGDTTGSSTSGSRYSHSATGSNSGSRTSSSSSGSRYTNRGAAELPGRTGSSSNSGSRYSHSATGSSSSHDHSSSSHSGDKGDKGDRGKGGK